jgi:hypothetical protein
MYLKENGSEISKATFNKLQVSRNVSEKALQTPVTSTVVLFQVHRQTEGEQKDNWHFCIFVIPA